MVCGNMENYKKYNEELVWGHLKCENCKYNSSCEDLFDGCVANYILDDEIVYIKSLEVKNET